MKDLYKTSDLIKNILEEKPATRDSDDLLYFEVCKELCPYVLDNKLGDVLLTFNDYDLPRYESVGRARRKIQSENPWLVSSEKVRSWRTDNEEKYREFAQMEVR